MSDHERRRGVHGPGGGERSEPEPGPCTPKRPRTPRGGDDQARSVRVYTPEERRAALEAYEKSGLSVDAFARTFGVSPVTFQAWRRAYREHGPKGLEHPFGRGQRGRKALPPAVREEIVSVKRRFPDFGFRKVRDFLARFQGLKVSSGGVRSTLAAAQIPPTEKPKRRGRRQPVVRRFERSRPRELWQSDITSYVLARESRRVYLTVFLDDFSRYVVSFGLELHQRQELVTEALLEGIARFGKPKEVLTDQGRQYFAWRGKSDFQKLLAREGIAHVVARAHHPQTVGKCERLWETIGQEFWDRVHPADLAEARERLSHFFAHYNHFRPHQGIDGLVPADRFFMAEESARKTIEAAMAENELRLALGERPRKPVFLFGQIGDRQVSLSGERGRLVVRTPDGAVETLQLDELGTRGTASHEQGNEHGLGGDTPSSISSVPGSGSGIDSGSDCGSDSGSDSGSGSGGRGVDVERIADRREPGDRVAGRDGGRSGAAATPPAVSAAAHAHVPARLPDPRALAPGERGGAEVGARAHDGDTRVLGGDREQERERRAPQRPADPALADEPARGVGDGVCAAQAAEEPAEAGKLASSGSLDGPARVARESCSAPEGDRAAQARPRAAQPPDRGPEVAPQHEARAAVGESGGDAVVVDAVGEGGACARGKAPDEGEEAARITASGGRWRGASEDAPRGGVSEERSRSDSA